MPLAVHNHIIAIIREIQPEAAAEIARSLLRADVRWIEVSFSDPENAALCLRKISSEISDSRLVLGAGTITNLRLADAARDAGATYMITPGWDRPLVEALFARGDSVLPGVLTPGEVMQAQELGVDTVKLFPATAMGEDYVKALKGPFPNMSFVAVGGVSAESAPGFLQNGFCALGVGGEIVKKGAGLSDAETVYQNALAFVAAVKGACNK